MDDKEQMKICTHYNNGFCNSLESIGRKCDCTVEDIYLKEIPKLDETYIMMTVNCQALFKPVNGLEKLLMVKFKESKTI